MSIIDKIRQFHDDLTAIRRDLHAHPEMGLEEVRTSDLVARKLAEWGIEVHRQIGVTGLVGVLRRGEGPTIGLRADMDCLPIEEETNLPYRSTHPGKMHACGHDGHTTMLLGAARYLAQSGNFKGTVNFIFQPAEEGRGGAEAMIRDKLFERFPCDAVFAMHNRPGLPIGQFAITKGPAAAGAAFFDITVTGKGGHGARPEATIDPVLVASHIHIGLQTIVARNVAGIDNAVLSVTRIRAGEAYNVIPQTAHLGGTARAFKPEVMKILRDNTKRIAQQIGQAFGAEVVVDFRVLCPPVVNDAEETDSIADAAEAVVGAANVNRKENPSMGSEDFSFMLQKTKGAYIMVGNGDSADLHNPAYNFNDEAIPYGAALFATLVEKRLA